MKSQLGEKTMKEFNLILDKVSQALGMTVDNVVKVYPHLRTEYSWYYVLDNINEITSLLFIIGAVALSFILPPIIPYSRWKDYKTPLRIALCVLALLGIAYIVSFVLKGFLCPDILIIERVMQ